MANLDDIMLYGISQLQNDKDCVGPHIFRIVRGTGNRMVVARTVGRERRVVI
jgi:hypothetical protein